MAIEQFGKITYDDINNLENNSITTGKIECTGNINGSLTMKAYRSCYHGMYEFRSSDWDGYNQTIHLFNISSTAYYNQGYAYFTMHFSNFGVRRYYFKLKTSESCEIDTYKAETLFTGGNYPYGGLYWKNIDTTVVGVYWLKENWTSAALVDAFFPRANYVKESDYIYMTIIDEKVSNVSGLNTLEE